MYAKLQEMIQGNINFLTTQIQPWMDKYNCRNAFELFNHKFEDMNEKVKVMGYVHRRDAFVYIGNQIGYEQTSIGEEVGNSVSGVVPAVRKNEIIINAFQREVEEQMQKAVIEQPRFVENIMELEVQMRDRIETLVSTNNFDEAIPYLAVLWYNNFVEGLGSKSEVVEEVKVEPGPDDEPPLLLA